MYFICPAASSSDLLMLLVTGSASHLGICSAGIIFRDFITVIKYHDEKQLIEERVYFLAYSSIAQSIIKEVEAGTQTGQGPGGRSRCRGRGGMLLYRLAHHSCSACSQIASRITSPAMAPFTVLPHQPSNKKMYHRLAQRPICCRHFSIETPSSKNNCVLCQVNINSQNSRLPNFHREQ